jgi:hypothetical protein
MSAPFSTEQRWTGCPGRGVYRYGSQTPPFASSWYRGMLLPCWLALETAQ